MNFDPATWMAGSYVAASRWTAKSAIASSHGIASHLSDGRLSPVSSVTMTYAARNIVPYTCSAYVAKNAQTACATGRSSNSRKASAATIATAGCVRYQYDATLPGNVNATICVATATTNACSGGDPRVSAMR